MTPGFFKEHIRAKDKLNTTLFLIPETIELFTSAVSLYELYMGATTTQKENDVIAVTAQVQILPLSDNVAYKAAQLYNLLKKQNKLIELRDIFIAATCIVNELPLVTLNKNHFSRIKELELV